MKRLFYIFVFFTFLFSLFTQSAHADEWTIYASYHNATKAVKTDSRIFVLANGDLFSYDTEDSSVETYDKTNSLNDLGIYDIAYSAATKQLVLLYENGNIDLLAVGSDIYGSTVNLSDLKNKAVSDKTFNELKVVGSEALISLNSGLVIVDLKKQVFNNFYQFDGKVKNATISSNKIYVNTSNGIFEGDRSLNLLAKSNWKKVSSSPVPFGLTEAEKAEAKTLLETVNDKAPNSPIRNYSYKLNMIGQRLLVAGGNFYYNPEVEYPATAMKYEDGKWTMFEEDEAIKLVTEFAYHNVTDIVQDPNDSEHHWLGTKRSGIYEFQDYKLKKHYGSDNSPITSILPDIQYYYCYERVTGLQYDHEGNLWMMNNECDTIVRILTKDGKWKTYYDESIEGQSFLNTTFDKRGWAWLVQVHRNYPTLSCLYVINTNGTLDNKSDDQMIKIASFVNQDNAHYSPDNFYYVKEDLDGAIWVATSSGLFVTYDPSTVFNKDSFYLTQVKVPRNDGSNLADYLLNGVSIRCIAIDGGNRKWIGTNGNGVYLVSADGLEIIEHFTEENSPLISNSINDIAINGTTGEVFFATYKGLCSFKGNTTDPSESLSSDALKVFPNPVRPEYGGDVHITGLAYNSNVKIADAGGKLVYEGISNGGRFDWNCCYKNGKKVASGIYYALCTDEEGKKGACAKILIVR